MSHNKTSLTSLLAFYLLFVAAISCSSDDDNQSDNDTSQSFFARVNSIDYNPEFITGFETEITNTLVITGSMGDGEQIQIFLSATTPVGTYDFADDTNLALQAYYQATDGSADDVAAFATTGSLTINTLDTTNQKISGTFNFSGLVSNTGETFTVSDGTFNVSYDKI